MKSSSLFLLPILGAAWAGPTTRNTASLLPRDTRAWVVSNNVTIDQFEEPDESVAGVRFIGDSRKLARSNIVGPIELEARQDDNIETQANLGETQVPWGCEADVREHARNAIEQLCRNNICDEGSTYVARERTGERFGNLQITASGEWEGDVLGTLIEGVVNLESADANTNFEHRWQVPIGKGGAAIVSCPMTRFPNFMAVTRRVDGQLRDRIRINIEPPTGDNPEGLCIALGVLGAISGVLSGLAGGFFGVVNTAVC